MINWGLHNSPNFGKGCSVFRLNLQTIRLHSYKFSPSLRSQHQLDSLSCSGQRARRDKPKALNQLLICETWTDGAETGGGQLKKNGLPPSHSSLRENLYPLGEMWPRLTVRVQMVVVSHWVSL